ncbi:MAG: biotin--[acetyl-CoA-carboxylase] ligase [Opitutae bacterium]|nr:biotin--[acetyl-CoA-carboxylase] ligase [Opitutae bacterium]|tara:strand:- start:4685 stop:5725 length:1041 start_codon:yes stop_codon:yes gene_type:complete
MSKKTPRKREKVVPKLRRPPKDPGLFLLRTLLAAFPQYVSGTYLAQGMKMSRVGVWNRVNNLRMQGLGIDAARNRGYRLTKEPALLNQSLLEAHMDAEQPNCRCVVLQSVDSTNSEAERLLNANRKTPFAVFANQQEKGRGRLGRTWHSPATGNLYLSVAFRPKLPASDLPLTSLWFGLKICHFLRDASGLDVQVKWPNDLLIQKRKMGGMLAEAKIDVDCIQGLVVGIGLNVNSKQKHFPKSLTGKASSFAESAGHALPLHELASGLVRCLIMAYEEYLEGLDFKALQKAWKEVDALQGQAVQVQTGKELLRGIARGIDQTGSLVIRLGNGKLRKLRSADVTLST